ncbi:MAG: class A beta-lactamase-related serine hydrolase [Alphaproteobacteria bacterium]|nr:MAG: class A beta-lactamase-related serine hydrolase [Alphaproteobacteria bacterium]
MSAAGLEALKDHFQAYVDDGRLAGLTTLVARHGKVVQFETYGQQDKEAGTAMADDTIFRIYSMTKPITGVALMSLYEEGKFQLDDPVAKYLPEFADAVVYKATAEDGTVETEPAKRPITIRDLMRHTAGLTYGIFGNTAVDQLYRARGVVDFNTDLASFVTKLADQPLLYQPGDKWVYSFAVDVQGRLVEVLAGQSLDQVFAERIFGPLGMKDTAFATGADKADRLAVMYVRDKEGALAPYHGELYQDFTRMPPMLSGGGGLVSTTADYWRFAQMMLNGGSLDGVQILKPETVALMSKDQLPENLEDISGGKSGLGFGLDFAVVTDPAKVGNGAREGEYFWGGMANTVFWIDPKEDIVAVLMTNVLPSSVYPLREEFRQQVYDAVAR